MIEIHKKKRLRARKKEASNYERKRKRDKNIKKGNL